MAKFEFVEAEAEPYLYVERSTTYDQSDAAEAMGSAFGEVWKFMQAEGIAPTGGALTIYTAFAPERIDFRTGFTVAHDDMARASGSVKADVTPAGRVAHGTHKGPYARISQSLDEMRAFIEAEGDVWTPPHWEVYINSPAEVPEEELLTELYQALA